ncbi:alpha/beta hydrolase [Sphingobium sp. PNB]|uniref:alpha/beta fold hydrolase n=1 Tax=Sphingobium sp. PNB TaxID=863934 RepID=UPI001CA43D57|nr:alpha/beta hydrolase [Sphingobium sp. PNB]MCB4858459.1 alpha/beta hydrolase [Sphingobium sp. PNB]
MSGLHPLAPGSHLVTVENVPQAYHVAGRGPICIAHPGGPGADWGYMRMPLLEERMTMVYLEPIGTGASGTLPEHPKGYTIDRYSLQLHGLLTTLDLSNVFLLGHSHGGFVAQEYALAHPERLAGLILYATAAVTGPEFMQAADVAIRRSVANDHDAVRGAAVLNAWQAVPATSDDASYTDTMRGLLPAYFADPDRAAGPMKSLSEALRFSFVQGDARPFDVREALSTLTVPTLIMVGEHDFICGPRCAEPLRDALPDATLARFPGSGHFIHIEQAAEFAGAVYSFVEQHGHLPAFAEGSINAGR